MTYYIANLRANSDRIYCALIAVCVTSNYANMGGLSQKDGYPTLMLERFAGRYGSLVVKAKFHYTIQLTTSSRACLRPARELVRELLAAGRRPACARCVRVAGQIPLHYPACDQLASWSQAGQRNGIWSPTGLRPASEQDSVIEYGLNRSATRFESR